MSVGLENSKNAHFTLILSIYETKTSNDKNIKIDTLSYLCRMIINFIKI